MIFGLLAPPQGAGPKKSADARPIHVSNSHTKFVWISSNGLGGDSMTDGQGDCNILIAFLKKRGDNYHICLARALSLLVLSADLSLLITFANSI